MTSTSRRYVVGLVVDHYGYCVLLRGPDSCRLHLPLFSVTDRPSKLALALYAMNLNRSDARVAGFDPHPRARASSANANGDLEEEADPMRPLDDVVGSVFEYPESNTPGMCFRLTGVIRRPSGQLLGRATSVYRGVIDDTFSEEEYIHKLSWPLQTSIS